MDGVKLDADEFEKGQPVKIITLENGIEKVRLGLVDNVEENRIDLHAWNESRQKFHSRSYYIGDIEYINILSDWGMRIISN